jgi:hypothetical protein
MDAKGSRTWDRAIPPAFFLVAIGLRVVALAILGLSPEAFEYEDIALSLLSGQGYQRTHLGVTHYSQGPPFFPFFAGGVYALTSHSQTALVVVQIVLSSLVPVVIYRIGRALAVSWPVAALAAAVPVAHPGLIVYAVKKLHPLSCDALLIALAALVALKLTDARGRWPFGLGGAVLGVAILSRPTIAVFGIVAAGWLATHGPQRSWGGLVARIGCFIFGAALVVSPWVARNYVVHNRVVFVTTDTAELFWRGNHPGATGTAYLADGRPTLAGAPEEFRRAVEARDELGQYDLFFGTAVEFVRTRPNEFMDLLVTKWTSFWWFPRTAGALYPVAWLRLYEGFYAILLGSFVLGLVALWFRPPARDRLVLIVALLLAMSVAQSLFYVEIRHRWGVEPLMALVAAHGLGWAASRIRSGP